MKKSFVITIALLLFDDHLLFAQTDIADARTNPIGSTVTVTGIVTNGSEFGIIRYIQDSSGGIAAYPGAGSVSFAPLRGASVTITGKLSDYNGLLEINPVTAYSLNSSGNPLPTPLTIIPAQMSEPLEAQLVILENCTFSSGGTFAANINYPFTGSSQSGVIRITGTTNPLVGQTIPVGGVDITGILSEYNTVYQLLPRDQNDIVSYVAPALEINVLQGMTTVLSGSDFVIGNNASTLFTIENQGASQTLNISNYTITGTDSADFSIDSMPSSVGPYDSADFTLNFTPTGPTGSKFATISIGNDDSNENPYIINIYGLSGNYATEPTAQPTNLLFSNVKSYTLNVSYTAASPAAEKYMVLRKNGLPVTASPVDGITYQRGDYIGTDQVAYIGSGASFTPNFIVSNTDYYFMVFAFNGSSGYENYLTINPLSGDTATPDGMINNYYTGISTSSPAFVTDLSSLINPHTTVSYVNYLGTMINNFESRDTTLGRKTVTCVYTGENIIYTGAFNWSALGYSREHSYPHSWMPTYPADNPEKPEYNDQHNLFPTNLEYANIPRSNYPLGEVVTVTGSYLEGILGLNAAGKTVYEPRNSHKGDAARAMMYMAVCYNGISGNNWSLPSIPNRFQDQNLLKEWHFQDPPDDWEIARNDYIASLQNNRNPFVDSVNFACYIDFYTMTKIDNPGNPCYTSGIFENITNDVLIILTPNPNNGNFMMNYKSALNQEVSIKLYDITGRVVYSRELTVITGNNFIDIDATNLDKGIYIFEIVAETGNHIEKLVVE